jgi:hypothetical protein
MASREAVLGLDPIERRISYIGACIALVLAVATLIEWVRNTKTILSTKPGKNNSCPTGYHLAKKLCEKLSTTSQSQWELKFFFILIVSLLLLYFTVRSKRAGVACFAVFLGFGMGFGAGFLFFFLGAWLILRAYRLQKYGDASFTGSNKVAKEMNLAKREGRTPKLARNESIVKPATTPTASKRYTPKKPPRRR